MNEIAEVLIKIAGVIGAASVIITLIYKIFKFIEQQKRQDTEIEKLKVERHDYESVKDGMLSLLRAELIRSGEKYIEQKWIPIYAKDAYENLYKAYHNLGGNGTMTQLYENVMKLPTSPPKNVRSESK